MACKVAYIMDKIPATRNNDRALSFELWKEFHPDQISHLKDEDAVTYSNFLTLPKSYDIQRYRAHIQNDLGLFMALPEIQEGRQVLQYDWKEEMILLNSGCPRISIYSDESGRDKGSLVIGSLWFYERDQERFAEKDLNRLRNRLDCKKLKFSKLKEHSVDKAKELFDQLLAHRKAMAFKALIVKGYKDSGNRIFKAYKEHFFNSIEFEIARKRLGTDKPKMITIIKDKEENVDFIELESLKREMRKEFAQKQIFISDIHSLDMERSVFLQLIDLFCGSINRRLSSEENNVKDDFAGYVLSKLEINKNDFGARDSDWVQVKVLDE
jgi:hypothetical protein